MKILLLVMMMFQTAKWTQEPKTFRGIPIGGSMTEVKKMFPTSLTCENPSSETFICALYNAYIGDENPFEFINLFFVPDKLDQVIASFPVGRYDVLRSAFVQLYGPPHKRELSQIKTKLGIPYDQEILSWSGANVMVTLSRYSENVERGRLHIVTKTYSDRFAKEEKQKVDRLQKALQ